MLAVQTHDGDLRVWSVTKSYNADDPAKVVRVLRRNENFLSGPNWMGWSKNGRIIQYSDSYVPLNWPQPKRAAACFPLAVFVLMYQTEKRFRGT